MGLRQYLDTLNSAEKSSSDFATSAEAMRKEAAAHQLAQQAPDLLNSGDINSVVGLAAQAGNNTPLNELISGQMKLKAAQAKSEAKPSDVLTPELAASYEKAGVVPNGATAPWVGKPLKDFQSFATVTDKGVLADQRIQAQKEKDAINKIGDTGKAISKLNEKPRQEVDKLQTALDTYNDKPSKTAAGLLLTEVARAAVGGRVPIQELGLIGMKSIPNEAQGLLNYATGLQNDIGTVPEKEELNRVVSRYLNAQKNGMQTQTAALIKDRLEGSPETVLDKNGNIRSGIKKMAASHGLDVKIGDDGQPKFITSVKTAPQTAINPETGAPDIDTLAAQANLISDPNIKASALAKIQEAKTKAASGHPLNSQALSQFAASIKQFLPK